MQLKCISGGRCQSWQGKVSARIEVQRCELEPENLGGRQVVCKADLQKFWEIYGVAHVIVNKCNQIENFFVRWLLSHGCQRKLLVLIQINNHHNLAFC